MKRFRIIAALLVVFLVIPLLAAGSDYNTLNRAQRDAGALSGYMKKGADIAYRITELTGVALSPLVGLVVVGGIEYFRAAKGHEPVKWYFSLWFLGVLVLFITLIGLKDTIGEAAPFFKKPLDVLDFIQHKFAGIIAFAIVAPRLVLSILEPVSQTVSYLFYLADPAATAWAAEAGTGAVTGTVGVVLIVAIVLSALAAAIFFGIIWLAAGAVETLVLFAPVPFVGIILRVFRLSILGALGLGTLASPIVGILLSLLILYISYRILGWSFRLSVFGWVLTTDILSGRRNYLKPEEEKAIAAFSTSEVKGAKNRSYGRLTREKGAMVFAYRPFLILPKRRIVVSEKPSHMGIARGMLFPSVIIVKDDHKRYPALFGLPPRYTGHEEAAAKLLGLSLTIHDQRFRRHLKDAWRWIVGQAPDDGKVAAETA